MFLYLGGDRVISTDELIGIFDVSVGKSSPISASFLDEAAADNRVEILGREQSKSLVVTRTKVYYSPISAHALKKRVESVSRPAL